jgi:hypothetical protein
VNEPDGLRILEEGSNYGVTPDGRVWSAFRRVRTPDGRRFAWARGPWRPLKPGRVASGHMLVVVDGESRYVHDLVAAAFIGRKPMGLEVRHRDGNPANNAVSNLLYGTRAENMADAIAHGTTRRGERNARAKLSQERVLDIRRRKDAGQSVRAIANDLRIPYWTVHSIVYRKTWRWL